MPQKIREFFYLPIPMVQFSMKFWRDNAGNEVDIIQETPNELIPYEVKSSQTITSEYTKGIEFWNKINQSRGGNVIYGGHQPMQRSDGIKILGIRDV